MCAIWNHHLYFQYPATFVFRSIVRNVFFHGHCIIFRKSGMVAPLTITCNWFIQISESYFIIIHTKTSRQDDDTFVVFLCTQYVLTTKYRNKNTTLSVYIQCLCFIVNYVSLYIYLYVCFFLSVYTRLWRKELSFLWEISCLPGLPVKSYDELTQYFCLFDCSLIIDWRGEPPRPPCYFFQCLTVGYKGHNVWLKSIFNFVLLNFWPELKKCDAELKRFNVTCFDSEI